MVLDTGSPKSKCCQHCIPSEDSKGESILTSFSCWYCWHSLLVVALVQSLPLSSQGLLCVCARSPSVSLVIGFRAHQILQDDLNSGSLI